MNITNDIYYVGVNDHQIDLFEGQYIVPNGMSYNSYIILDEKIAVMDTVDANFGEEWLNNIKKVLNGKTPNYLIIQHMEPDHSANITTFMEAFPQTTIVASAMAFQMMKKLYGKDYSENRIIIKENDTLCLGNHTLTFLSAAMVHWPEVMVSYDSKDKVLFSADGFGKFGALDIDEEWDCEARRYYFGIVGKFGNNVQTLLKKAKNLEINTICPLHGPILNENLNHYIEKYDIWSSYNIESEGVMVAYTSVYGNTKKAALTLQRLLIEKGVKKVVLCDLQRDDMAEAVEDAFRYGKLILASPTYNSSIFPHMREFINELISHNYQNRTIALVENGLWAPTANKVMRSMLENLTNVNILDQTATINGSVDETAGEQLNKLVEEIIKA